MPQDDGPEGRTALVAGGAGGIGLATARALVGSGADASVADVDLGIGTPTLVAHHLPEGVNVVLPSGNGVLGMGPFPYEADEDPDLISAGQQTIALQPGASAFGSATSFGMVRGGPVKVAILGAVQVSGAGDLANWPIPGKTGKGMGAAMGLVAGTPRVIVLTEHVAKDGSVRIRTECDPTITGVGVADRTVTDLCVVDVEDGGLVLGVLARGVSEDEVPAKTDASFRTGLQDVTPESVPTETAAARGAEENR